MDIEYQIEYLRNYFKIQNVVNESKKKTMTNVEVEKIRKFLKKTKEDGLYKINHNFSLRLKDTIVYIKDSI